MLHAKYQYAKIPKFSTCKANVNIQHNRALAHLKLKEYNLALKLTHQTWQWIAEPEKLDLKMF